MMGDGDPPSPTTATGRDATIRESEADRALLWHIGRGIATSTASATGVATAAAARTTSGRRGCFGLGRGEGGIGIEAVYRQRLLQAGQASLPRYAAVIRQVRSS